jgi:hypothetical protein
MADERSSRFLTDMSKSGEPSLARRGLGTLDVTMIVMGGIIGASTAAFNHNQRIRGDLLDGGF